MLATVRIMAQQQQPAGRRQNEQDADLRFLHFRPALLGPGQQECAQHRSAAGGDLHQPALRIEIGHACDDDAKRGDLRNRQIDKDDAAL